MPTSMYKKLGFLNPTKYRLINIQTIQTYSSLSNTDTQIYKQYRHTNIYNKYRHIQVFHAQMHTHTSNCALIPTLSRFLPHTQHTATYCNTLQQTETHYNTMQYTATYCNKLHHTSTNMALGATVASGSRRAANSRAARSPIYMYT